MKLFEVEVNAQEDDDEKVNQIVYSLVDLITELEEDGKKFKITIEDLDYENTDYISRYLH